MDSFDRTVIFLATLYAVLAFLSLLQIVIIHYRDNLPFIRFIFPVTVQQKVHSIIVLLCIARAAYFILAINAWNPNTGKVVADAGTFYTLDEFSTLFFFSLACILALFWAELYYIAIDKQQVFTRCVRPATYSFNVVAYIATGLGAFFSSVLTDEEVDYTFWYYSLVVSVTYCCSAIIFTYYAINAAREINEVPIHLSARQQRLQVLKLLAFIFIAALIIRSIVILCLMGVDVISDDPLKIFTIGCYFLLSDILPIATAIGFYRVEWIRLYSDYQDIDEEQVSLLRSWGESSLGRDRLRFTSPSVKSRDEIIASIIDRLSEDPVGSFDYTTKDPI